MKKNMIIPSIVTFLMLVVIIYLFASIKQPYVECSKRTTDSLGIVVNENLVITLSNNKISKMHITKKIILPDKYLNDDSYLEEIKQALIRSYSYLSSDVVTISRGADYLLVDINTLKDETIILNNISFIDVDGLQIKINPNTKSSEVVTLKIKDKYTEGEVMTKMKNSGYVCKQGFLSPLFVLGSDIMEYNIEKLVGEIDFSLGKLNYISDTYALTNREIEVLNKYDIDYKSCVSLKDVLNRIEDVFYTDDDLELDDLEEVSLSIAERDYYQNTNKQEDK